MLINLCSPGGLTLLTNLIHQPHEPDGNRQEFAHWVDGLTIASLGYESKVTDSGFR
jgi:hypothetical protein